MLKAIMQAFVMVGAAGVHEGHPGVQEENTGLLKP